MGLQKGCEKQKGSGRRAGTPNKRGIFSVQERLRERNYDLVSRILDDMALIDDPVARAKIHLQLLEYTDARRKAIAVDTFVISDIEKMNREQLISEAKRTIAFLESENVN